MIRPVGFFCEHPLQGVLHSNPTEVVTFHCPRPNCSKEWTGPVREVLEKYRDHVLESDHVFELEDCGCCGCQHFPEFDGDCREDWERF
jgi:hypothetical protein